MMYIDVLDTILWKVWASTENQKDQKQHETALLFLQHASTGIQTRNSNRSERSLSFCEKRAHGCPEMIKSLPPTFHGLLWRNLATWSSVSIVTWGVIKSEGYYHLRVFHRWDPASPGRFLSCGNVFFWKNGFLREQFTVVYLFNLFHLPPFETIPADGRQPVNAVHSLLASNTDLPVAIYNHPTSL